MQLTEMVSRCGTSPTECKNWSAKEDSGAGREFLPILYLCLFISLTPLWRWRQHDTPKRWSPATSLHGVTTQNNTIGILIDAKISNVATTYIQVWGHQLLVSELGSSYKE